MGVTAGDIAQYYGQAKQQVDPTYNAKATALKNSLAQNTMQLDQSKTGINNNYNNQVSMQNLNNMKSRNNISNNALGRGLSASSIVTSGLGEADQINNRLVNQINTARTGDLNNIEAQKAMLANNMNNTLAQMEGDKANEIWTLARQLQGNAFDQNYKNAQLDASNGAEKALEDYRNRQLLLQRDSQNQDSAYKNASLGIQRQNMANSQKQWEMEYALKKAQQDNALSSDAESMLGLMAQADYNKDMSSADKKKLMSSIVGAYSSIPSYNSVTKTAQDFLSKYGMNDSLYNTKLVQSPISQNAQYNNINNLISDYVRR
jgi:hypothetical protein